MEQKNITKEGPYTMVKLADGVYSAEGPTTVNLWCPSEEAGMALTGALNAAYLQAQAAPPAGPLSANDIEQACEVLHDAYEAAATQHGWKTQEASRKPWSDVPDANKATMRSAVGVLLSRLSVVAEGEQERSGPSVEDKLYEMTDRLLHVVSACKSSTMDLKTARQVEYAEETLRSACRVGSNRVEIINDQPSTAIPDDLQFGNTTSVKP